MWKEGLGRQNEKTQFVCQTLEKKQGVRIRGTGARKRPRGKKSADQKHDSEKTLKNNLHRRLGPREGGKKKTLGCGKQGVKRGEQKSRKKKRSW